MFYVTYEIGKAGKRERERRHFPWLYNRTSNNHQDSIPRGRVYIPHGNSLPHNFHPHMRYILPEYTENGLDWNSRIRSFNFQEEGPSQLLLRQPSTEIWDTNHCGLRPFPHCNKQTENEWFMHPESDKGIKTSFGSVPEATKCRIFHEDASSHPNYFCPPDYRPKGKRAAYMIDERNGWRKKVPGDKSYSAVEFEPGFYRHGAPVSTSFFGLRKERTDTFIPLLPKQLKIQSRDKRKRRSLEKLADIQSVIDLDKWQPSSSITKS